MSCDCARLRQEVDNLRAEVDSLLVNIYGHPTSPGLAQQVRLIEKRFDTGDSPAWKRLLFRIDGWGPWFRLRSTPRNRPWRRWWTS